jgi:prepilin-type N-terminal cleavage/methylation domain-containing protein
MAQHPANTRRGFSLVEMLVVVVVLATLAALVTPNFLGAIDEGQLTATTASLKSSRDAALSYEKDTFERLESPHALFVKPESIDTWTSPGVPGWNGPYLITAPGTYPALSSDLAIEGGFDATYGLEGEFFGLDAYARPIVLQIPDLDGDVTPSIEEHTYARWISAGPNGVIETPRTNAEVLPLPPQDPLPPVPSAVPDARYPSKVQCNDDLVLYLKVADLRP